MSKQEVLKAFGDDLDSKLVQECISICKLYNLSPNDLFYKWEASTSNFNTMFRTQTAAKFDMEAVVSLKATLQRDLNDKKRQTPKMNRTAMVARNRMPVFGRNPMARAPATPQMKKEIVDVDMGDSTSTSTATYTPSAVVFRVEESKRNQSYRYMYEKVLERSEILDDQIAQFGERISKHYGIKSLADPASTTEEEVTVVGRISQDTEQTTSTKLDESTLIIDTSRNEGSRRVPVRFEPSLKIRGGAKGAGGLGFFPGMMVALKGKNGGGGWFSVSEILIPPPYRTLSVVSKSEPKVDSSSFSVCICCGPYTSDADLEFKPWRAFLSTLKEKKPTVLILLGPFVDATHKSIQAGDIDHSPLQLFQKRFTTEIRNYLDSAPGSIAVLVPNTRDLISSHAVYPQGAFESDVTNSDPRIRLVSNPASFSINNVTFGITTHDIVFHLKSQEVGIRGDEVDSVEPELPEGVDGIANACRHLLQQQSYYPMFPVPLDESERVNLDLTHSSGLAMSTVDGAYAPDVLVVPTRLKQFVKNLDGTTAVNPGFMIKGTCALLQVKSSGGSVKERLSVEILRTA